MRPLELEDEAPSRNYALQLTEGLDDEVPVSTVRRGLRPQPELDSFAIKLNEALQAISGHDSPLPLGEAARSAGEGAFAADGAPSPQPSPRGRGNLIAALDTLPPIKLPVGPAIPWRFGLPALAVLVILMLIFGRPTAAADTQGVQLPAQQTYSVQQESPLFAKAQPTDAAQPAAQPSVGAPESNSFGLDLADIALKLIVVLALAYGSLMLLRRFGIGGASSPTGGNKTQTMRVVSSLALAPNRSVHVIELPGGKTLLVGATPNAVNLLTSLDEPIS